MPQGPSPLRVCVLTAPVISSNSTAPARTRVMAKTVLCRPHERGQIPREEAPPAFRRVQRGPPGACRACACEQHRARKRRNAARRQREAEASCHGARQRRCSGVQQGHPGQGGSRKGPAGTCRGDTPVRKVSRSSSSRSAPSTGRRTATFSGPSADLAAPMTGAPVISVRPSTTSENVALPSSAPLRVENGW